MTNEAKAVADKGPWEVSADRKAIHSLDFTRDVMLSVSGDFASYEDQILYMDWLRDSLNAGAATEVERLEARVRELERALTLANGWNGDPQVSARTAVENANALTDIQRERADAAERRVAELTDALRFAERHCPCGARPESPDTHPHMPGCLIASALDGANG